MDQTSLIIFTLLVFATVFFLTQSIIVPTFGTERQEQKRIRKRIQHLSGDRQEAEISLVREQYLKQLSPFERWLDKFPGNDSLNRLIMESGDLYPAYRLLLRCCSIGIICGSILLFWKRDLLLIVIAASVGFFLPIRRLMAKRNLRLQLFEQQLPDALDSIVRALKVGIPFRSALSVVATEMRDPAAQEFALAFDEIKYGRDVETALAIMLERVPSLSMTAVVTAVSIQLRTGGNLAEVLAKISRILRERFRFKRSVDTLTAQGRISAWVLALIPFVLFAGISVMDPQYLEYLTKSRTGIAMISIGVVLLLIGMIWINRLIKIRV